LWGSAMQDFTASAALSERAFSDIAAPSAALVASCDAPVRSPCSPRCRTERVVVVGGANGRYGAQTREYHDLAGHLAAYEPRAATLKRQLRSTCHSLAAAEQRAADLSGLLVAVLVGRRPEASVIRTGRLAIDLLADTVYVDGDSVPVAPSEWLLLTYLATRVGETVPFDELIAWLNPHGRPSYRTSGRPWRTDDRHATLRGIVMRLRHRLGQAEDLVKTIAGVGLMLRSVPLEV
jgi:hypothetical protein